MPIPTPVYSTNTPTTRPKRTPTNLPTTRTIRSPTNSPTSRPKRSPTNSPTIHPTDAPIVSTTKNPTKLPTHFPTSKPTKKPSTIPSRSPTESPSTKVPTQSPSFVRRPSEAPSISPIEIVTTAPTGQCNLTNESRTQQIQSIVRNISLEKDLADPISPQSRALEWIINGDSLRVCPQNARELIQRYVLAVFYFSVGGGSWDECNAPLDLSDPDEVEKANDDCTILASKYPGDIFGSKAWLTPTTECEWGGLSCYSNTSECPSCLGQISFGTCIIFRRFFRIFSQLLTLD